jgi:TonB-dependent receptor
MLHTSPHNVEICMLVQLSDHLTKTILVLTLLLVAFICTTDEAAAQHGRITGKVTEKGSNEILFGANVIIKGTNIGTATDSEGRYVIPTAPLGSLTIVISYIGFQAIEKSITMTAGQTINVNVELEWVGVLGTDVVVTAQARGQISAINQQLSSNRITNVVSADRIRELPDVNAAESIGRLPGIAIQRSGGEANKISIRGLSPKFNSVTVNGVRVPSVDTNDRSVDLSLVSSNMLDGIEVTKALTPDQDADALGGTVDLRLRSAPDNLFADFQVQGGYTALQRTTGNYKIVGSVSNRFFDRKLGVIVGINTDKYNRSADQFSGSYQLLPNPQNENKLTPTVNSLNLRENSVDRSRLGGNALIDYRLPRGKIVLNTFYNFLGNDGSTRVNEMNINSIQHKYAYSEFKGDASIMTSSLNIEQSIGPVQLDVSMSTSASLNKHPEDYYWDFMEESAYFGADLKRFVPPSDVPNIFRNNLESTYFNYLNVSSRRTNETENVLAMNAKWLFNTQGFLSGNLKTGAKIRFLERSHDVEQIGHGLYYGGDQDLRNIIAQQLTDLGLTVSMNRFPMTAFQDTYGRSNFLNGEYPLGYTLRGNDLRRVTEVVRPLMNYEGQSSLSEDYSGSETYTAAYVMTELNIGDYITLIPGFRYEKEQTDYSAKFALGTQDAQVGLVAPAFRDTSTTRNGNYVLPMVHLKVKPVEWLNIRMAYTNTLSRPTFREYAPITYVSAFKDWLSAPNTNLKTSTAKNYDISMSIYQNRVGLFTVSAFYKEISDLVWGVSFPLLKDQTILPEIKIPNITGVPIVNTSLNNSYPAVVKGIEFDWQTNFWYLPSLAKGLVLNINYTLLQSETKYPQFFRRSLPIQPRPARPPFTYDVIVDTFRVGRMPDQPSSVANVTLGYDYKGFSARVSYLYQSDILRGLASNPENDRFTSDYWRMDASVKQTLPYRLQLFGNFNNLNNRKDSNYQSSVGIYPTFIEYYGFTMDVGLRYTFE